MQRFTQGLYGYAFALVMCLAVAMIILFVSPVGDREHIPSIDYTIDAANARQAASYQVWLPAGPPRGWVPTSSRLVVQKGVVTWRLGFATAARSHAMLAQSDERPAADYASRMANSDRAMGTQRIGEATWERRLRPDKNQRTLIRVLPDVTLIVTGQADWPELATLAGSLRRQPPAT